MIPSYHQCCPEALVSSQTLKYNQVACKQTIWLKTIKFYLKILVTGHS